MTPQPAPAAHRAPRHFRWPAPLAWAVIVPTGLLVAALVVFAWPVLLVLAFVGLVVLALTLVSVPRTRGYASARLGRVRVRL